MRPKSLALLVAAGVILGSDGLLLLHGQEAVPPPNSPSSAGAADGTFDAGAYPGANRGVARISIINGDVSVRRGDSGDVVAAAVNAPVMVQDSLLTSSSSRSELQFDPGTMLRVGANSEVRMATLDNNSYQLQLAIGTITLRVSRPDTQSEIDTPSVAVRPLRPGTYRVTVREDGSSEITIRDGEAEIASGNGMQRLGASGTMLVRGRPEEAEFQTRAAAPLDAWDRWNLDRDRLFENSRSAQYVGPDVPGTEELDNNGRWVTDPNYGQVWAPNTSDPNWAPYRDGDWTWEDYYGWTWVSADPWGWAPYHYGRWFHGGLGWCWWPGPIYGRHFWAPAYVGFFGFGGGTGFGFGFGNLGWVALAPFERFHPWWGAGWSGRNIFENSRLAGNGNILNAYRNARFANGVTGVAVNQFGRRGGAFSSFNGSQIQNGGLVRGMPSIAPGHSSLALSNRAPGGTYPQTGNRTFFSRSGSSFGSAPGSQRTAVSGAPAGSHDWSRFGAPIHGGATASPQQTSGWRGFGAPGTSTGATRGIGYQPRSPNYSSGASGGAQALRINPPIVQQRAQPRAPMYSVPGYNPAYNNGRSMPSYSAPSSRPTAPSYNGGGHPAAAPSSGGRPSGASSGGGHTSSGGGGHHR